MHNTQNIPMTDAEHWWNHLSFPQRQFICARISVTDSFNIPIWRIAYTENHRWEDKEGWPVDTFADMHASDHSSQLPLL